MRLAVRWAVRAALAVVVYLWIVGLVLSTSRCASVPKGMHPGDVKGCYVTFMIREGAPKPFYEPFLKVADKETFDEYGNAEVWGFKLWDLGTPDEKGMVRPVNIRADRFIPLGPFREINGLMCRCPSTY